MGGEESQMNNFGKHSYAAPNSEVGARVGSFTAIGEEVYVHHADNLAVIAHPELVANFPFGGWLPTYPSTGQSKGDVIIGNDVWIGRKVQILTGVTIGDGAIIGAHSVIAKDVPPYAVVVGNPAVVKRFRFPKEVIDKLLKIQWWNWEDDVIKERLSAMDNINSFIEKYG